MYTKFDDYNFIFILFWVILGIFRVICIMLFWHSTLFSDPDPGEMYSIQLYVIKFVIDLRHVSVFSGYWPPRYNWKIAESGVKHHNPYTPEYDSVLKFNTLKQKCTYDYQLLLEQDSCILDIHQTSNYIFHTQACGHTGQTLHLLPFLCKEHTGQPLDWSGNLKIDHLQPLRPVTVVVD